jgi:hypothetical protein
MLDEVDLAHPAEAERAQDLITSEEVTIGQRHGGQCTDRR